MHFPEEYRRLLMYFLSATAFFGSAILIGDVSPSDIPFLTRWFLRIDGNNSPNATINWGAQDLINVSYLQAINISTEELHVLNISVENWTFSSYLEVDQTVFNGNNITSNSPITIHSNPGLNLTSNNTVDIRPSLYSCGFPAFNSFCRQFISWRAGSFLGIPFARLQLKNADFLVIESIYENESWETASNLTGIWFNNPATNDYGFLGLNRSNGQMGWATLHEWILSTNGDEEDFLIYSTVSNTPRVQTSNGADFMIDPTGSGEVDLNNSNLVTTGNVTTDELFTDEITGTASTIEFDPTPNNVPTTFWSDGNLGPFYFTTLDLHGNNILDFKTNNTEVLQMWFNGEGSNFLGVLALNKTDGTFGIVNNDQVAIVSAQQGVAQTADVSKAIVFETISNDIFMNSTNTNLTITPDELVTINGDLTVTGSHLDVYDNTVTVAKRGGDFTTIQGAIDSITDASATNAYVIHVYPGIYNENIVGINYTSIIGMGNGNTIINGSTGILYTFPDIGGCLERLSFTYYPTANNEFVFQAPSTKTGECEVRNIRVTLESSTNDIRAVVFDLNEGDFDFHNVDVLYTMTGNSTANVRNHFIIDGNGNSSFNIYNSRIYGNISDDDDRLFMFDDNSLRSTKGIIHGNDIEAYAHSSEFTGDIEVMRFRSSTASPILQSNSIILDTNGGGSGKAILINTDNNNGIAYSHSNVIQVTGFGNNFWADVRTGDTLNSHFDEIIADDGSTGTGTLVYAHSPDSGDFSMTGNFTGNQIYGEMWNYSEYGSEWTFPIASADVYYNLTNLSQTELNGFTATHNNQAGGGSYFTALVAGKYKADLALSSELDLGASTVYAYAIVKNFDIDNSRNCYARRSATLNNPGSITVSCFIDLAVNDNVNVQIESETASRDLAIHAANLNLVRIGN